MRKALGLILMVFTGFWSSTAQAEKLVIAALGDSLTQGYGLKQEDGFVPQLEAWLAGQGVEAQIVNAGVSGDTTAGGLSRVAWTLTPDVDAMIVTLGGNDLLRGLDPAQARSNIEGILQAADAADVEVMLIGMQAPGNFGPDYKIQFDAIYPELAEQYGAVYFESFFAGLFEGGVPTDPDTVRQWFQPDGIHPNAKGVVKIVAAIGEQVFMLIDNVESDN